MRNPISGAWCKLLLLCAMITSVFAQSVTTFEGIDASQLANPKVDVDPNGAVGTKQFLEWTNVAYQAYDKVTLTPVWSSPQPGTLPFKGLSVCNSIAGDGFVLFDRLGSRWVIAAHNSPGISGSYYYCVAVSNVADLSSSSLKWNAYAFNLNSFLGLNSHGHPYFHDWPKLGTCTSAHYRAFDLLDVDNHYQPVGAMACALDRTNMLANQTAR